MGERGSVLVRREQWHPGWAATRVLEQVRELLRSSEQEPEQEPERVRQEQEHLVLAVSREPVRGQRQVPERERS